jgi:hypothetical protein
MNLAGTAGTDLLPQLTRNQVAAAVALTLAWAAFLAFLSRALLAQYYPFADEWALLANADPHIVSPVRWFTSGFSDYFSYHPELSKPFANFVRPGFNFTYWLLGLAFEPTSSARLWFNFLTIGACSGLAYLCVAHTGSRWALPLAALVPLLPGYITASAHSVACLAYDPMIAALSLGALLAYERGRLPLTAALLLYAVMTKENSLPVAAAFPALHFLRHWRELTTRPWLRAQQVLLLGLPVVAWLALRLWAFRDVSGGTYAFQYAEPMHAVRAVLRMLPRWPMWVDAPPWQMVPRLSAETTPLWGLVLANLTLVAGLGLRLLWQWWRRRSLDASLLVFLCSDVFMLLVGIAPRYGAVTLALLVVCVARWLASREAPRSAAAVTALMIAGVAIGLSRQWAPAWELQRQFAEYGGIARSYVQTLKTFPAGSRVIVLNDPTTWHSRLRWLLAVEAVPAEVYKVADYTCPNAGSRVFEPCAAEVAATADPLRFEFTQSCGFDLCNAVRSGAIPIDVTLEGGVQLAVQPEPPPAGLAEPRPLVWRKATVTLDRGDAWLLWFDPAGREFHRRYVPAHGKPGEPG